MSSNTISGQGRDWSCPSASVYVGPPYANRARHKRENPKRVYFARLRLRVRACVRACALAEIYEVRLKYYVHLSSNCVDIASFFSSDHEPD